MIDSVRSAEQQSRREELPTYLQVLIGIISLVVAFLVAGALRLGALWSKMMAIEVRWFAVSFVVIISVCFLVLIAFRRMPRHPAINALVGAVSGFVAGTLATVIAGYVRGGVLFRLKSVIVHPLDSSMGVLMTATWLVGVMIFLIFELISTVTVRFRQHSR